MSMTRAARYRGWPRIRTRNPLEALFRLLTSVRFAIALIAFIVLSALLGVVLPQVPDFVRGDPTAHAQWLAAKGGAYWVFAPGMDRLQLFDVFHSYWFTGALAVLMLSIAVCTASRFPPIWRSIRRPQRRVNDRYFETAHHRASFETPADARAIVGVLQRRRYVVSVTERDGATYLYADRFGWAQLETFASHLALLIFLAGGVITWRVGFRQDILAAPGQTEPVNGVASSNHMQLKVLNFTRMQDAAGHDVEYRTDLAVYKNGVEVARGSSTVNNPFTYDGYVFHQASFEDDGARLAIRDAKTGAARFDEALQLVGRLAAPLVTVKDAAGDVVFHDYLAPTKFTASNVSESPLTLPDGRQFWVAARLDPAAAPGGAPPFMLGVLDDTGQFKQLRFGGTGALDNYTFAFTSMSAANYLAPDNLAGMGQVLVETLDDVNGQSHMTLVFPDHDPIRLEPGQPVTDGGSVYTFGGATMLTGIQVKKDPGSKFIWIATGLILAGLAMTFYLPRRRLWAKITPERIWLAGIADRSSKFSREMEAMGAEAAASGTPAPPAVPAPPSESPALR